MWNVYVRGVLVKSYTYKLQAVIYCLLKGYVYTGTGDWYPYRDIVTLDPRVKIIKEKRCD